MTKFQCRVLWLDKLQKLYKFTKRLQYSQKIVGRIDFPSYIRQFCERCCKFKLVDVANGMQGTFRNIPAIHSIVAVSSGTMSAFLITAFLSAM